MIGFYNYTVIATYISLMISTAGIFLAFNGDSLSALVCLMISGLIDGFDGRIARLKTDRTVSEKRFGIQIDSLSDLICFGILPVVTCYSLGMNRWWQVLIFCIYILNAQIRLAFFNVEEEERQAESNSLRMYYNGLPVTSISLILPCIYLFTLISDRAFFTAASIALVVVAAFFIIPVKIRKVYKAGVAVMIFFGSVELVSLLLFC